MLNIDPSMDSNAVFHQAKLYLSLCERLSIPETVIEKLINQKFGIEIWDQAITYLCEEKVISRSESDLNIISNIFSFGTEESEIASNEMIEYFSKIYLDSANNDENSKSIREKLQPHVIKIVQSPFGIKRDKTLLSMNLIKYLILCNEKYDLFNDYFHDNKNELLLEEKESFYIDLANYFLRVGQIQSSEKFYFKCFSIKYSNYYFSCFCFYYFNNNNNKNNESS